MSELEEIRANYTDDDLREIRRLRNYYRRNFARGISDENFMIWLEGGLRVINEPAPVEAGKEPQ